MDKPEGAHEYALKVASDLRVTVFEITKDAARIWGHEGVIEAMNSAIKEAILSAQSQAYIDAARIAEEYDGAGMDYGPDYQLGDARKTAQDISAAILSRKDEVGSN